MSTTTSACTTPTMETVHVSPSFHPPQHSGWDSGSLDAARSRYRSMKRSGLSFATQLDPFLLQYTRPQPTDKFSYSRNSLCKHRLIKNIGFYEKYFTRQNEDATQPNQSLHKRSLVERKVEFSPKTTGMTRLQDNNEALIAEEDAQASSRRRRLTGSGHSTPLVPSKKVLPSCITKSLPEEFMQCDINDLVILISRMLQSLINLNDRSVPDSIAKPLHVDPANPYAEISEKRSKLLTRYHSRSPPAISIQTYLARLTKFNNFSQATLLTTIYYIDLLSHNYQPFFTLNSWTVHRFLLVATMLGQKALEDFFHTNDHYAKVGGVALTELNCLELDFLDRVDWKLVPAKQILNNKTSIKYYKEVLTLYYVQLVTLMEKNVTDANNIVYKLSPKNSRA